jgi:DeoR/GlpR family transcriptional regulator of sugar metabolism
LIFYKFIFYLFSQDYQEFNTIRLAELETLYQTKLETIRNEFTKRDQQQDLPKPREIHVALDSTKKEHRTLIEQNQLLKDKLGKYI